MLPEHKHSIDKLILTLSENLNYNFYNWTIFLNNGQYF